MSDDTPRRTYHSGITERHSPIRGKVTQPCELMVVGEVWLCLLMDTNIVIVAENPENNQR